MVMTSGLSDTVDFFLVPVAFFVMVAFFDFFVDGAFVFFLLDFVVVCFFFGAFLAGAFFEIQPGPPSLGLDDFVFELLDGGSLPLMGNRTLTFGIFGLFRN